MYHESILTIFPLDTILSLSGMEPFKMPPSLLVTAGLGDENGVGENQLTNSSQEEIST